jgi:hypothetical protein
LENGYANNLVKLEKKGLLKTECGNYVINKARLDNYVIRLWLVPKAVIFVIMLASMLIIELCFLPDPIEMSDAFEVISIFALLIVLLVNAAQAFLSHEV